MGAPSISTGLNLFNPPTFLVTPSKGLIILNGVDRPLWWNGLTATADLSGVTAPTVAPTVTMAATGGASTGDYACYYRYLDRDGYPSNLSPVFTVTAVAGQKFSWSVLTASAETRVSQVQIFRSLAGVPEVVYLVATITNGTTTYNDNTLTDTTLAAAIALPILNPDGTAYAQQFTPPPSSKAVGVMFQDRAFYAVDVHYTEGTVSVSNGSATLTGTSTAWTSAMVGRYFTIAGDTTSYLISAYTSATSLTISTTYGGTGGSGQSYVISPTAKERNVIYYSSPYDSTETNHIAGPEAVLATNQHLIQDNVADDDELTGLIPVAGSLFATKQRHVYRVSFVRQPNVDMVSYIVAYRGCLNQRCWTTAEDAAFIMDQKGIYRFSGSTVEPISEPIGDLFKAEAALAIDWTNSKWFWAESQPTLNIIKFHVALTGDTGTRPKRAIVFNYQLNLWWLEQFPWEIGGGAKTIISGRLRTVYGAENDLFYVTESGTLDGLDSTTESGTIRGTVTSATSTSLVDSGATFPATVATSRVWVSIVSGTGKGQSRLVTTRTSDTALAMAAWDTTPVAGDEYIVGAVEWLIKFTPLRFQGGEEGNETERSMRITYLPTTNAATLDMRQYKDHATSPLNNFVTTGKGDGVSFKNGNPDAVVDLKKTRSTKSDAPGYSAVHFDSSYVDTTITRRWITPELRGYQGVDRITIYGLEVEGAAMKGSA